MLDETGLKKLHALIDGFSKDELIWINGYLSGIVAGDRPGVATMQREIGAIPVATKKISLVFGTETGNAKKLATDLAAIAKKRGVHLKLISLDQYRLTDLPKEEYFFVVISTQGEGEPPLPAKKFYDHLHQDPLNLPMLKFSVLALGDTSYPMFCKTGEDVDIQLQKLGGRRVAPLRKCDVDYEADAREWFEQVLKLVEGSTGNPSASEKKPIAKKATKKYYNGNILTNIILNDRGSNKETHHIEIGAVEPIEYEPGDTIGVIPRNREEVVDRIVMLAGIDPAVTVETAKVTAPVKDLLVQHLSICYLLSSTVKKYAAITQQEIPDIRMDLVDLLRIYPVRNPDQFIEVMKVLMPIAPRLYSVASSPAAHGENEIHITVAKDQFLAQDEQRFGLCSEFLGDLPAGSPISFYVHKDKSFKLPAAEKDIIMIGPGTGVAPFRAFLAERDARGASGKNWFFFGEQHFVTDFLYQTEIQSYAQTGVLHRLDLAFSRDQPGKIYVQHRMKEKARELYSWIEAGASVYVSGTKDPMSKDVENCLLQIISEQGGKTEKEAQEYLECMRKVNRYAKDVY